MKYKIRIHSREHFARVEEYLLSRGYKWNGNLLNEKLDYDGFVGMFLSQDLLLLTQTSDLNYFENDGRKALSLDEIKKGWLHSTVCNFNDDIRPEDIVQANTVKDSLGVSLEASNPKAANGAAKLPLHLWSPLATAYGSVALENGGLRYGYGNYKATPVKMSIYLAAMLRHIYAFMENQEFDEVDGTPHLGAILANCAIILEARAVGTLVDDRPITGGYVKESAELTKHVNRLQEMYKDRNPRHYTVKDNKD